MLPGRWLVPLVLPPGNLCVCFAFPTSCPGPYLWAVFPLLGSSGLGLGLVIVMGKPSGVEDGWSVMLPRQCRGGVGKRGVICVEHSRGIASPINETLPWRNAQGSAGSACVVPGLRALFPQSCTHQC